MNNIVAVGGSLIRKNMRQYGMIIALVVVAILFQTLTNGILFRPMNIANLVTQNGHILILAVGMMPVIITGRVDLSVGSLLAFTSAMSGIFIISMGWPLWLAIPAVLGIGILSGAWNGYWIAYKNVPFFVVTLGGMLVFRGLTMYVLEGMTLSPFPPAFHTMAAGFVPGVFGGSTITAYVICLTLALVFVGLELRNRKIARKYEEDILPLPFFILRLVVVVGVIVFFAERFGAFRGVPNMLILLVFLVAVYHFVANNTVFGRHVYAVGGNAKAAELSGIKAKRVVFWVYVNMGMLAALAGIMFAARLNAATPRAEAGFELQAIAAAFIGGASPGGGIGKIAGAIIGAMLMGVLNNGLSHRGIGADVQLAITGLVLLAAVIFDVYTRTKVAK